MLRRFLIAGLAAGLVAPAVGAGSASAAAEFAEVVRCAAGNGSGTISPGLGHTETAQSVSLLLSLGGCSGAESSGSIDIGPLATFPDRPLGCAPTLGGAAGNSYPEKTPLLFGNVPNGFTIDWGSGASSSGRAKVKAAAASNQLIVAFTITSGRFRSPPRRETKIRATLQFAPSDTFDCSTNSDRIGTIDVTNVTDLVALRPKFEALAVGDSITSFGSNGYGTHFRKIVERRGMGHAGSVGSPGTNPCGSPWGDWIRDYPKSHLDYVILEDWYVQDGDVDPCPSVAAWRAAWQETVNAAKAKGAFVIMLAGTHPDLSSVAGIDIREYPVPPADHPDGVHYTTEGYVAYARNVANLLRWLEN